MLSYIYRKITRRWKAEGGYRDILVLGLPLIVSTASWSVQLVVDRAFLSWYSPEAIAASVPAGILNYTIVSLFVGAASYVSTFVAQYHGSDQDKMVGPSVWQGIYVSIIAGVALLMIMPFSESIFDIIGHENNVRECETIYFQILCLGAMPNVASSAMSGFFSGLGKTKVIMFVNISATLVNLSVDYVLIFGKLGFPELGITGAGIATVTSVTISFILYTIILSRQSYRDPYNTVKGWRLKPDLFIRLMRFGLPSGVQFFLEIAGFTVFILLIGRLGTTDLAATNIAMNINTLAFMPLIGLGIAISVMVAQNQGKNDPDLAQYSVYSGFHITMVYILILSILFVVFPEMFIWFFELKADPEEFKSIKELVVIFLRFIAVYAIFDALNIVFASAIKGAGDTKFVMYVITFLSMFMLVIPTYAVLFVFKLGIYAGWMVATSYMIVLGTIFLLRFLGGKWKSMRVIDEPHFIPPSMPEGPAGKYEV